MKIYRSINVIADGRGRTIYTTSVDPQPDRLDGHPLMFKFPNYFVACIFIPESCIREGQ